MNIAVLTPDREIFQGSITSVKVPGVKGEFQVLLDLKEDRILNCNPFIIQGRYKYLNGSIRTYLSSRKCTKHYG